MLGEFLHHWLVADCARGGPEDEAQVEVECIPGITLVQQADRIAKDLLSEHGSDE